MTDSIPPVPFRQWTRAQKVGSAVVATALVVLPFSAWVTCVRMPGSSHRGPLPPATTEELALDASLRADLTELTVTIGERNTTRPRELERAAQFIERELARAGYTPRRHDVTVDDAPAFNIEAERTGDADIVLVGAHYDSASRTPGANDNGSGVVALLAIARAFSERKPRKTVRFVAFVNEEPPWFGTSNMGSTRYARRSKERGERIVAMLSLETLGSYSDREGSQRYPFPFGLFYPERGDFIGFVSTIDAAPLVRQAVGAFRRTTAFPSEGIAAPQRTLGIDWSDHRGFLEAGYPAVMVTDTAPFRYPHYHQRTDTIDQVDTGRLARVTAGLVRVVDELAR